MPPGSSAPRPAIGHQERPRLAGDDATGGPRRRQRVDSDSFQRDGSVVSQEQSAKPNPKRIKSGGSEPLAMAVAAAFKGKGPEMVDLTRRTAPFQPHIGAKKLVIKNVRTTSNASQVDQYYRRTWDELGAALRSVFAGEHPKQPLEMLYRGVEDICRHGEEERVYKMLKEQCEHHLNGKVFEVIRSSGEGSNVSMLSAVHTQWQAWNSQTVSCSPPPRARQDKRLAPNLHCSCCFVPHSASSIEHTSSGTDHCFRSTTWRSQSLKR